jgi:hypothetical protein
VPGFRRSARVVASFATVAGLLGCSPAPLALGTSPEILWWTDHEEGGLSGWSRDGAERGGLIVSNGGEVELDTTQARSGLHAMRATVTSPGEPVASVGVAMRNGILPKEAYYSAWYYIASPMTAGEYWLFFKYRSRRVASDPATVIDLWDVDFSANADGTMGVFIFHHDSGTRMPRATPAVPVGQWFQVEAFFRAATDDTGRLMVWFDGTLIYDLTEPTVTSEFVEWSVGSIAEIITPAPATLYVDDAAISTSRLGPAFPIFWRAPQP